MPKYPASTMYPIFDPRSPAARLEALVREADPARKKRIWQNIFMDLTMRMKPDGLIAAARELRDRGVITTDAYYHLAETFTLRVLDPPAPRDPELERLDGEIEAIERAHGVEQGEGLLTEAPPEYLALNDAWNRRRNELVAAWLRARGHADVASLMESDYDEFDRRTSQGRIDVWPEHA